MAEHGKAGTAAADADCEGDSGGASEQGESHAMAPHPLVLGQVVGRADGETGSGNWLLRGLSGVRGNSHAPFLGGRETAMSHAYPTVDLFRCESVILQSHWVMDQFARQIIGFSVHAGPVDGPTVCRLFNSILGSSASPRYLSSDNDPLFKFHRWKANLRILDVEEVKTLPYVPLSHPFVERLIGTVRREFLDHVPFWGTLDLERKLHSFKKYYNQDRAHRGLGGAIPDPRLTSGNRKTARLDDYRWKSCCRGLYQLPTAA